MTNLIKIAQVFGILLMKSNFKLFSLVFYRNLRQATSTVKSLFLLPTIILSVRLKSLSCWNIKPSCSFSSVFHNIIVHCFFNRTIEEKKKLLIILLPQTCLIVGMVFWKSHEIFLQVCLELFPSKNSVFVSSDIFCSRMKRLFETMAMSKE